MRYWNCEMLGTLNNPGGSKGKMKLGGLPGSSAQVAVPPLETVPPVGTVVPLAAPLALGVVGDEEHAANSNAAAVVTAATVSIVLVRLIASPLPPAGLLPADVTRTLTFRNDLRADSAFCPYRGGQQWRPVASFARRPWPRGGPSIVLGTLAWCRRTQRRGVLEDQTVPAGGALSPIEGGGPRLHAGERPAAPPGVVS